MQQGESAGNNSDHNLGQTWLKQIRDYFIADLLYFIYVFSPASLIAWSDQTASLKTGF